MAEDDIGVVSPKMPASPSTSERRLAMGLRLP
jgi:hypothetical protein